MFDHDAINFQVQKVPLYTDRPGGYVGAFYQVPDSIGVGIQKDDGTMLGIVSENYEVVQYNDIVSQVEEALVISGIDMYEKTMERYWVLSPMLTKLCSIQTSLNRSRKPWLSLV